MAFGHTDHEERVPSEDDTLMSPPHGCSSCSSALLYPPGRQNHITIGHDDFVVAKSKLSLTKGTLHNTGMQELKAFADGRMIKRIDYFSPNFLVTSSLEFLQKIIDNLI